MRARAAAGSVLEFGGSAHSLGRFCFFSLEKFLPLFSSGGYPLPSYCFRRDPDGPDEAQQFASQCSDDLSRCQPAVALVQPVLRLPGYLFDLFRNSLLPLPQRRSAEAAKQDQLRARHRLSKFLLRSGQRPARA